MNHEHFIIPCYHIVIFKTKKRLKANAIKRSIK